MTPCEKLGYKVGDKFEVIKVSNGGSTKIGMIIYLCEDDGSKNPFFKKDLSDINGYVYVAELKDIKKITDSEGWIEWKGGECPVEKGTLVDVKYRNGHQELSIEALFLDRDTSKDRKFGAGPAYWIHDDQINDIIAYRLSETKKNNGDDLIPFNESDDSEYVNKVSEPGFIIVNLISSVAPNVSVSDALEIASTLQEHGFKK